MIVIEDKEPTFVLCRCSYLQSLNERVGDVKQSELFRGLSMVKGYCCLLAPPPSLRSAVCLCIHSAWQEIIACPPHSTSNKRAVLMRAFLCLSFSLSRPPSLAHSSLSCLSMKCWGSLSLDCLERAPSETAAPAFALVLHRRLLLASESTS